MGKLFGTDGVRGFANKEPMTAEMALRLGKAIVDLCQRHSPLNKIVVGKDTRLSGDMLESALVAGICSMGADALLSGTLPTPGIAFITQSLRADAGVVISASHNPYCDNGIKFFQRDGYKLTEEQESELENFVLNNEISRPEPEAEKIGNVFQIDDAGGRYIVFAKASFPEDRSLEGLRIILDCSHGAAYKVAPAVLSELGAEVICIGVSPDGKNINDQCGSQHTAHMAAMVKEKAAHIGIALDGDGDRVILSDEQGNIVDGDAILAFCGRELIHSGGLPHNTVVATVMSNIGLEIALKEVGGKLVRTAVGDRHVVEEMRRSGYLLGGEQSGHMVFGRYTTTGDGIISALQVLALMQQKGVRLSELAKQLTLLPQQIINVPVSIKKPLSEVAALRDRINQVEKALGEEGRTLIRYSGTEPLLRIMVEGADSKKIQQYAEDIAQTAQRELSG